MSITLLKKLHYKTGGSKKYLIDCTKLMSNPDNIELKHFIKNENYISIIEAIMLHHPIKNNKIVIKIGGVNKTIKKEFDIGEKLKNIPGFIKYICLFNCYDDTHKSKTLPRKICQGGVSDDNNKYVLIMPYVRGPSFRTYQWNNSNILILKSLLKQLVMSCLVSFLQYGLLHSDLHLDNILFKKTKLDTIKYIGAEIPSNGYKLIILDFEMSFMGITNTIQNRKFYWDDLLNTFSRLYELKTVICTNLETLILQPINYGRINLTDVRQSLDLLDRIDKLEFIESDRTKYNLKYNPNID